MPFPDDLGERLLANEADVETRLILPLLHHLGYTDDDIASKYPVVFQEGRRGRRHEADYVVFDGAVHSRDTSLLVVEAKGPNETLENGMAQGASYAANLRAPFLLLTNGRDFELWQLQISAESQRVLFGPVSSIASNLGELDLLISKAAAIRYAKSLLHRHAMEFAVDLRPYYEAELSRTVETRYAITRQLFPFGGNGSDSVLSSDVLGKLPSGFVSIGPSGYGKSTLAISLLRQAIETYLSTDASLPILYLEFPDVVAANQTILRYVTDRIAAHCPQITELGLKYLLRSEGGVLICDGFDRLDLSERSTFLSQIKSLRRDYPQLRLFVFSRVSVQPEIGLPLFELKEYSKEEQVEYIRILTETQNNQASSLLSLIPEALDSLFKVPLLLRLGFTHWLLYQNFPTDLNILFRSWIEHLLQRQTLLPSQAIDQERGLRLFANNSVGGSLRLENVIDLFRKNGLSEQVLNDLVQNDALRLKDYSVELPHESLGDYLRAAQLAEIEPAELAQKLSTVELDVYSMFPILLIAQIRQHTLQRILLARLAALDLTTYFDALRYRANVSSELLSGTQEEFAKRYFEDMLDGIEQPLHAFFPLIADDVIRSLTGSNSQTMSIVGHGSPEWMNYEFQAAGTERVTVGPFIDQRRIHGSNLKLLGLRADSGRVLGISQVKDELLQMPKQRHLKGDIEWRSERVVGWIRFLSHESDLGIDLGHSIDHLTSVLRPHAGKIVSIGAFPRKEFLIDTALEDLVALQERGDTHLNVWWTRFGNTDHLLLENEENTRQLFDEFYRRVQLVYREVVEHSFDKVSASFGFYTSLPVRWDIALQIPRDPQQRTWAQYSWRPVQDWDQAGADLKFTEDTLERFGNWDFSEVQEALRKLGRLTRKSRIWIGSGITPRFEGSSMTGAFYDETPVMREVCNYIHDDLRRLFKACPGGDIPYPERSIQT